MIFAQAPEAAANGSSSFLWLLVAFVAIYYFMIIRPQRRRQRESQAVIDALEIGDHVRLYAGIRGTVVALDDDTVTLQLVDGKMVADRRAVAARLDDDAT